MVTLQQLTELLGWSTVINMGILLLAFFAVTSLKGIIIPIHNKLLGMGEADLTRAYFQYLANYKIVVLVFNLTPYVALKIMGQ